MRRHRRQLKAAVLLVTALLAGCGIAGDVTEIKLAHGHDTTHPVHAAMVFMAERLAEKSGGKMRIDIYTSQQLGTERETLELLQIGSLGMTKVSSSVLEGFAPPFRVLGLPYLFRDEDHRFAVLGGDVGRELLEGLRRYRLLGLTYYDAGSRSFYTVRKPVHTPDDLAGLKLRTQESPIAVQMVRTLGGAATPISYGEVFTALQQGVVDGAENNPPSFQTSRHYEVAKYYTLDEHTAVPDLLLISLAVWNDLEPQQQQWLQEAADESAELQQELWRDATEEALEVVREAGVEVIYPDKDAFLARAAPLLESFSRDPEVGPIVQRILSQ
jgi:tripartite ATP-independent transporter DctP family solute receptor